MHVAIEHVSVALREAHPRLPDERIDMTAPAQALAEASDRRAVLEASVKLEDELVDAYRQSLPLLPDAKIAMTVATILASHAQHRFIVGLAAGGLGS